MTRHTRVSLVHERTPASPETSDLADLQAQVRALAAAVEQLADAIDVLTAPDSPPAYADDHVTSAREELRAVWGGPVPPDPTPSST